MSSVSLFIAARIESRNSDNERGLDIFYHFGFPLFYEGGFMGKLYGTYKSCSKVKRMEYYRTGIEILILLESIRIQSLFSVF